MSVRQLERRQIIVTAYGRFAGKSARAVVWGADSLRRSKPRVCPGAELSGVMVGRAKARVPDSLRHPCRSRTEGRGGVMVERARASGPDVPRTCQRLLTVDRAVMVKRAKARVPDVFCDSRHPIPESRGRVMGEPAGA